LYATSGDVKIMVFFFGFFFAIIASLPRHTQSFLASKIMFAQLG
jgi:hypothetical protein